MNFAPGPAMLPLSALEQAQADLVDYQGTGISIVEHSHRAKHYAEVHAEAKHLLRELLSIPKDHEILFMQGGATAQFALVPMNFLTPDGSADYVVTGTWGEKAFAEAKLIGKVREAACTEHGDGYQRVPRLDEIALDPEAAYLHLTSNNTIFGTQFHAYPKTGDVPLVVDMSSDIAWRPMDFSQFGLVYAGAQKNLGIPGVTLVIIRRDLLSEGRKDIPKIFRYKTIADGDSLQNTAPTFAIYMVRNVLRWLKEQGGVEEMERRNRGKAELLYGAIDARAGFYRCPVEEASRSVMNVVFRLPSVGLEQAFLSDAAERSLVNLKGHRSVGGIRVSMYNACPPEQVQALIDFMHTFAEAHA